MVSEVMLQQTQVSRVIPKYEAFIQALPDFRSLAKASTAQVLELWQGLGYNRRALNLQRAAQVIMKEYGGKLPHDPAKLVELPGIGKGTAGSIAAFAFNEPVVFIETNIRRVFINHFFADTERVSDAQIMPLIEVSLDHTKAREWYWALMDYGAWLGANKAVINPNRASRHYTRQSTFEGSQRQLRGALLRYLLANQQAKTTQLKQKFDDSRLDKVLAELTHEGFIVQRDSMYYPVS